jgi:hypothetical protein
MKKGKVVAYDVIRGWGWVECDGEKVFFHIKNSNGFIPELGAEIEFETVAPFRLGQRDQAVNLRKVESAGGGAE